MIDSFLADVIRIYKTGSATEHSYRPALERLFNDLRDDVSAINEPKRVKVGAPDFVFRRGDIVIGHCEAKDVDVDLKKMKGANAEQKKRYTGGLSNLIYTNCLHWMFYRDGEVVSDISIADYVMGVQPKPERFAALEQMLRDFIDQRPQTITSSKRLAERMAGKAILIKDILANALTEDKGHQTELYSQYEAFKEHLIHDISISDFADLYAETIAYGMFAARLHDTTLGDFSRQEALDLLPKSNPFLRNLFGYIAGPNLDVRISWIIDDLAEVFQATNVAALMENFGKTTQKNDPFLHFYETFLAAYNPTKRKARGVWYTPEPVVNFIVRAVDDVLKTEFGLSDGLANTSKVTVEWDTGQRGITKKGKLSKSQRTVKTTRDVHRVQILDPAAGTGTFLAEVIKQIAPRVKAPAPGMWSSYVENDLIPRLHGFELLMASYAMCHMKLDMMLTELGYQPTKAPPRLSVFLTNSLEEGEPPNQTLPFAQWLSNEVKQANAIKRDMPIMVVLGNPPYNPSSANTNDWIGDALSVYKRGLQERKVNLDDDYIKFLRLAELFIEKNDYGVIAMITNNSFLDGTSHRIMRKHFLDTFDEIHILNLHGDIRSESAGVGQDDNVFDITQGVTISVCVRNKRRPDLARVQYGELIGSREEKYKSLEKIRLTDDLFTEIEIDAPQFRFKPQASKSKARYERGIPVNEFFRIYSSGIQTKRDKVCVAFDQESLREILQDFKTLDESSIRKKYALPKDGRDWSIQKAKSDLLQGKGSIIPFLYKPFDQRFTFFSGRTKGFVAYPRREVMQHIVGRDNIALICNRQNVRDYFSFAGVTKCAMNHGTFYLGNRGQDYCFPVYLYPDESDIDQTRRNNFDPVLYKKLRAIVKSAKHGEPDEIAIFDYIYGVLHCPAYRETYAELLKTDFPRIPWPSSPEVFWAVCEKGERLRRLHLMEEDAIGETPYPFEAEKGSTYDNVVDKPEFRSGRIYINKTQYFNKVPGVAWFFNIGGYQPAQKWLKDHNSRALTFDDVRHYQKIIKILVETNLIMRTIEMPL